jgi:glycosyltransferase involved in cell wall biosynthesis
VLGRDNVRGLRRLGLGIHSFFERPALRWSDAVISNDPALVDQLTRLGRNSRACVILDIPAVSEAVPEPARNLALARYKRFSEQRLVTCVGSYTRFKGLDLFFNAMPHVLASNPNVHFVVVGGSEQEIARVSQALEEAGLDSAVTFPGRIDPGELAALLAVSDVLVSPRRAGCCAPIKVLDYLLSGTPVVAADTPANRAVLTPDNAIITRPTPEALADGILKLCLFPHLADELGRRGRDTLREDNRTPEAFRAALQHCYEYVALQTKR